MNFKYDFRSRFKAKRRLKHKIVDGGGEWGIKVGWRVRGDGVWGRGDLEDGKKK